MHRGNRDQQHQMPHWFLKMREVQVQDQFQIK
jgi:hypothetical protein